jgi:hypothetical protein
MAARIKPVAAPEPGRLPTFATLDTTGYWDSEAGKPAPHTGDDLTCDETREVFLKPWLAAWAEWRRIQNDPAEAPARRTYAEHCARHLVGIYPNVRVSPDAYAAAMGEELGGYSADVVKQATQQARRTCKTLPTVAHLVEAADTEVNRRNAIARVMQGALVEYDARCRQGALESERLATTVRRMAPLLTGDAIDGLFRDVAGAGLGFSASPFYRERRGDVRAALALVKGGDREVATLLENLVIDLAALRAAMAAAGDDDGRWMAASGAFWDAARDGAAMLRVLVEKRRQPPSTGRETASSPPAVGARVKHAKFGLGTVQHVEDDRLEILFDTAGPRRLLASFVCIDNQQPSPTGEPSP